MPDHIVREPFVPEEHLELVQDFDCGSEEWQLAVSDWIKGADPSDSVVTDMASRGTRVWLYRNASDEIVGFGSLGTHDWSLPPYGKKKVPVVIIPNVAVASRFWGLPRGDTYADQIMDDLRSEAEQFRDTRRALVLCVHPLNQRAIRFYKRHGFVVIEPPLRDGHLRMAVAL